ncbi:MAG: tol-pal system protein YbgF [Desulfamplus sp.]
MKKFSKLSVGLPIFSASILMALCIFLISSCSSNTKTAKSSAEGYRESKYSKDISGNSKSNKSVEQRLDSISSRLERVEKTLGLNAAQDDVISDDAADINEADISDEESSSIKADQDQNASSNFSSSFEQNVNTPSKTDSVSNNSYKSPDILYKNAHSLLLSKNFKAAEAEFKSIADNYPDHTLAVNSLYWMGECRYSVKDYQGAVTIFKQLVDRYPDGRKVPDALLKTAYSYLSIKDNENAREYLKMVVKKFPFSPAGEKAEQKLQSLR